MRGGFETIVVDDASTDETADVLRRHAGSVRAIVNDRNAGWSACNNAAAREARGDVLLFLNSDTELLGADAVERLAAAVDADGVGLAGPMLVNPDGTLQPSCAAHPSVGRALLVGLGAHRLVPDALRARAVPDMWSHGHRLDTRGWLMGAALAVRADLFRELGGFWPTMYAEDEDLAYRVQQRGFKVRFEPAVRVMHVGNQSLGSRWSKPERATRIAAAELAFLRTHYGRGRRMAIRALTGAAYGARAVIHRLLRRAPSAAVYSAMAGVYLRGHARSPARTAAADDPP